MKKILLGVAGTLCAVALIFSIAAPAQASALTSAQIQAIIGLLQSFGADQSVINNVSAALGGTSFGLQTCSDFADLSYGNFDTEPGGRVSQLQTWLGISSHTFGFGTYGPKTLALWKSKCGGGTVNASFSASPTYGTAPLAVAFRSNTNGTVNFGDGTSDQMQSACYLGANCDNYLSNHTYAAAGTYTATLTTWNCPSGAQACTGVLHVIGTVTITVTDGRTIGGAPSISGLDAPTSLSVGQTGTWTVHASAPSGTQLHYSVVWGDEGWWTNTGSAQQAQANVQTSATFSHTYQNAGTYTPTFYVSNDYGSVQTSASVVVGGTTAALTLSASPTSGTAPLSVNFSYPYNSDTQNGQYTVNFGDGTSEQMSTMLTMGACSWWDTCTRTGSWVVNHTYAAAGTYNATLTTVGSCQWGTCAQTSSVTITVTGATSNATFSASPTSGYAPLAVQFAAGNLGSDTSSYSVDFGDGSAHSGGSCSSSPGLGACIQGALFFNHTYTTNGTYYAKLIYQYCPGGLIGACAAPQTIGTVTVTVVTLWQ